MWGGINLMAYNATEWTNREVERPRTFTVQNNPDGTITLTPSEGAITEPGTPIMADNMNKIEQGIVTVEADLINHSKDERSHDYYADDTGTANAKVVSINPAPTEYKKGLTIRFTNKTLNTGAVTINVNGLGNKTILKSNGTAITSGLLKANSIYTVSYNGTNFILQGEGGEYGTATATDVLTGKTLGTENGVVNGAIPVKTAATITPGTTNQTIAAGQYLSGTQTILGDADLISVNILAGANIFGVQGTSLPQKTATGSVTHTTSGGNPYYYDTFSVSGLSFRPKLVVMRHTTTSAFAVYGAEDAWGPFADIVRGINFNGYVYGSISSRIFYEGGFSLVFLRDANNSGNSMMTGTYNYLAIG